MKSTCPALTISKFWSKFKGNTSNSKPQLTKICAQGVLLSQQGTPDLVGLLGNQDEFQRSSVCFSGLSLPKNLEKNLGLSTYTFLETFFYIAFSSHSKANKYYHSQHVPKPQTSFFHFKILKLHFSINQVVKTSPRYHRYHCRCSSSILEKLVQVLE